MNEKIIAMVRRSPGIKTGQIADQMDVSFEEAQDLLQGLVLNNRLMGELVPLAGGGKVMSFRAPGALTCDSHPIEVVRDEPAFVLAKPLETVKPKIAEPSQAVPAAAPASKFLPDGTRNPEVAGAPEPKPKRPYVRTTPVTRRAPAETVAVPTVAPPQGPTLTGKIVLPPRQTKCCMWSDGVLEIQREGDSITFDIEEQKLLRKAMGYL